MRRGATATLVVSCHVERPLDDRTWLRLERLRRYQRARGLPIAALMRPPDPAAAEDEHVWLDRARAAAQLGPLGHHTHWTSVSHARPTGGDPAERVRAEASWIRERGLRPTLFCGGGWYLDEDVAEAVAAAGYVDCTARASRPAYLPAGAPWLEAGSPVRWQLPSGGRLAEVPTTHGLGDAARAGVRFGRRDALLHVYFHDYDLLDRGRSAALATTLALLRRRCVPRDLDELGREAAEAAREAPFAIAGREPS